MQVIGICRFSYPAIGGFQVEHDSFEERCAYLYAPERMEERFRFFEAITLPGLRAQTDPDFTFLIVTGDSMPDHYAQRLQDLVADFPQAIIAARPPGPLRQVMQAEINALRDDSNTPCLQFRHDDDDAVGLRFVELLRQTAQDCGGLIARNRLTAIDFNRGFLARPGAEGIFAAENFTPYYGVALAVAAQPGVKQTIMNFAHNRLNRFMPTVTRTDVDMFVRGHNAYNDSRQKPGTKPEPLTLLDGKGEAYFKETFAIDSDVVRTVFS